MATADHALTANLLKRYKTLATVKGRRESGQFLVEGHRAIQQLMAVQPNAVVAIIATAEHRLRYRGVPVHTATEKQANSLCLTRTPQGVVAVVREPDGVYTDRLPVSVGTHVLVLEGVQDPGNVGTLIRTAAAFNYAGVILSDESADPLSPKSVQAASGTVLSLWLRRSGAYLELVRTLKQQGYPVVTADVRGDDAPSVVRNRDRLVLALGMEASGPTKALIALSDHCIRIPVHAQRAESLNVAACGAIAMFLSSRLK